MDIFPNVCVLTEPDRETSTKPDSPVNHKPKVSTAAVVPVIGSAAASPINHNESSTDARRFPAAAASSPKPTRVGFSSRPYPVI